METKTDTRNYPYGQVTVGGKHYLTRMNTQERVFPLDLPACVVHAVAVRLNAAYHAGTPAHHATLLENVHNIVRQELTEAVQRGSIIPCEPLNPGV